jgi:hypothetical protein
MAYTTRNFRSKADLKRALAAGDKIAVYQPNAMFPGAETPRNGTVYLEGPHYPAPHTWYAQATIADGYIVKLR